MATNKKITEFESRNYDDITLQDAYLIAADKQNYKMEYGTLSAKMNADLLNGVDVTSVNTKLNKLELSVHGLSGYTSTLNDHYDTLSAYTGKLTLSVNYLSGQIKKHDSRISENNTSCSNLQKQIEEITGGSGDITKQVTANTLSIENIILSVGSISSTIRDDIKKVATNYSLGMIQLGYTTKNNNYALTVDGSGNAYVTITAGSGDEKYKPVIEALTNMSSYYAEETDVGTDSLLMKIARFEDGELTGGTVYTSLTTINTVAEYEGDEEDNELIGGDLYEHLRVLDLIAEYDYDEETEEYGELTAGDLFKHAETLDTYETLLDRIAKYSDGEDSAGNWYPNKLTGGDLYGLSNDIKNNYALTSWVNTSFLASTALNGYATLSWVTSQKYATKSWVSLNFMPLPSMALTPTLATNSELKTDNIYDIGSFSLSSRQHKTFTYDLTEQLSSSESFFKIEYVDVGNTPNKIEIVNYCLVNERRNGVMSNKVKLTLANAASSKQTTDEISVALQYS